MTEPVYRRGPRGFYGFRRRWIAGIGPVGPFGEPVCNPSVVLAIDQALAQILATDGQALVSVGSGAVSIAAGQGDATLTVVQGEAVAVCT